MVEFSDRLKELSRFIGRVSSRAFFIVLSVLALPSGLLATDLEPRTLGAFVSYVRAREARMAPGQDKSDRFLYIDTLPELERRRVWATILHGGVWVDSPNTLDTTDQPIRAPAGLINHWIGAEFIPGASLQQALAVVQDYDHYQDIYAGQIVRSRLVSREAEDFKSFVRVRKKTPWATITLNINSETVYTELSPTRVSSRSQSTRIAQVVDADTPNEHEYTPGHDSGYLWRVRTYWRMEVREGGLVVEWESITLSRDIPWLLRWIVKPYVERLARSTVQDMLLGTRKAAQNLKARARANQGELGVSKPGGRCPARLASRLSRADYSKASPTRRAAASHDSE